MLTQYQPPFLLGIELQSQISKRRAQKKRVSYELKEFLPENLASAGGVGRILL